MQLQDAVFLTVYLILTKISTLLLKMTRDLPYIAKFSCWQACCLSLKSLVDTAYGCEVQETDCGDILAKLVTVLDSLVQPGTWLTAAHVVLP
jgi:hypothetical protein